MLWITELLCCWWCCLFVFSFFLSFTLDSYKRIHFPPQHRQYVCKSTLQVCVCVCKGVYKHFNVCVDSMYIISVYSFLALGTYFIHDVLRATLHVLHEEKNTHNAHTNSIQ